MECHYIAKHGVETTTSNCETVLEFDRKILELVLKRNEAAHRRALYHRRCCMVLQCLRKRGTLVECLSRIQHAATALLAEISRGYFLPVCTVALACLARIRVILMRIGRTTTTHHHYFMEMTESEFDRTLAKRQKEYLFRQVFPSDVEFQSLELLSSRMNLQTPQTNTGMNTIQTDTTINNNTVDTNDDNDAEDDNNGPILSTNPNHHDDIGQNITDIIEIQNSHDNDDTNSQVDENMKRVLQLQKQKQEKKSKKKKKRKKNDSDKKSSKKQKVQKDIIDDIFDGL